METENFSLDQNDIVGCGCAACQQGQPELINYGQEDAQNLNVDEPAYAPSGNADPNTFANYLTHGYWQDRGSSARSWSQDDVTFSISNGYTASQKDGLRMALDLWSDVADIGFTEVGSGADMSFVKGNDGRAYSSSTTSGGNIVSNTISIDTSVGGWSSFNDIGNYAQMTALHEIGHSLGLGHTGNYNGSASYNNDAQWTNDTHQTTLMSYFQDTNVGSDHWNSSNQWQYSATPMLIDILAIQNIYGANYSTRSGNTTYGFNSNAGRDQYDFSITEVPIAIWDGGGIDTIDASGYSTDQTIYLTEGYFSSLGHMTNNLVIAYGAVIENAIGGSGDDTIYGNDFNNTILGGAGQDTLYGSAGDDILNGQTGTDSLTYIYSVSDFVYNFIDNTTVALTHVLDSFTDTIYNIENFIFFDGNFTFAELEATYGVLDPITVHAFNASNNVFKTHVSDNGNFEYDQTDTGFVSAGPQLVVDRDQNNTTITVVGGSPIVTTIRAYGTDNADTITLQSAAAISATIDTGLGNDIITTTLATSNDRIYSGAGNDIISTGNGNDIVYAGDGDDTVTDLLGNSRIYGGDGNDIINGGGGNDRVYGENGTDEIYGGDGRDRLDGGAGQDLIRGEAGRDKIFGGDDQDFIYGGDDGDLLYGQDGNDEIYGEAGNDKMYGGIGNDMLDGGAGHDNLQGEAGDDYILGGDGIDRIDGGIGNDDLEGGNGDDTLYGGDGDDIIIGGSGIDILYGQAGNDTFKFDSLDGSSDQIRDFSLTGGDNDILNITNLLENFDNATDDINDFVTISFRNADRTDLYINADGTGGDWEQVAVIRGSDFTGVTIDDLVNSNQLIA